MPLSVTRSSARLLLNVNQDLVSQELFAGAVGFSLEVVIKTSISREREAACAKRKNCFRISKIKMLTAPARNLKIYLRKYQKNDSCVLKV